VCGGAGLAVLQWGQYFEVLNVLNAERLVEVRGGGGLGVWCLDHNP